jgi:diaminohydroxyphosphoribosylaminopyrimidine deaminase/5-amino-6-(5-phosphoribosylamino)uracil reductase
MGSPPADLAWMERALALARKGFFGVEPNPPVGCVLVRGSEGVVGEGWHAAYGGPHAEVAALSRAGERARGATAYVSLAPCSRHGKTGPCTVALREAGVARVVYAADDPDEPPGREGLAALLGAGVEVEGPILPERGDALLRRFRSSRALPRPWVVLKWAMGVTGHIAARRGAGGSISGVRALRFVHDLRAHVDAVAVGMGTVRADDPRLTCRLAGGVPEGRTQPLRVVFDPDLTLPLASRLVGTIGEAPLLLFCAPRAPAAAREALEARGVQVMPIAREGGGLALPAALSRLRERGVRRLLVEGGARLLGSFLRAGLADQVTAIVAPRILGGPEAVPAVEDAGVPDPAAAPALEEVAWRRLGDDLLLQGYLPRREANARDGRPGA